MSKSVTINGKKYDFGFYNSECGEMQLEFNYKNKDGEPECYKIIIDKEGIKFLKGFYEPVDPIDGDGGMKYCNLLEKKVKDGKRFTWSEYHPGEDEDFFIVPFVE